jgi:carbohydrate-selective porin OprB
MAQVMRMACTADSAMAHAIHGHAAGVNVVYGTRGLWSLALVWWAGRWFGNTERAEAGRRVILARLAGAALLLAAVALAVGAA